MPRDIPVGNGKILICFDSDYHIRDLYFPHVGQENHVSGEFFRFGVWVDNQFSWVGPEWKKELLYRPDTLVTEVSLYHADFKILIVCQDAVDFHENIYIRKISVENMSPRHREVRLFFSHSFSISGNNIGDTAAFDPQTGGIVHYKGSRYFLINGQGEEDGTLNQFAVGQSRINDKLGTYKDAEDGVLSGNTIAQGSVDSTIALHLNIKGTSSAACYYWLAAGQDWEEMRRLDALVKKKSPENLLQRTADYWKLWVKKETPQLTLLPKKIGTLYERSLLVLITQIDWQGGIIAANDSDVIHFNRDTYSYIWPRDGALVANAMDLAGYPIIAQKFYQFAADVMERDGYFLHKFNPDGTLASSWHPWAVDGEQQLPIQEDETALVIWALWNHFVIYRDIEFIKPLYLPVIKNAAEFLCRYRDDETGLPLPSYDLWEERWGILSYTVGTVFGGLTAASLFCTIFGENDKAKHYQEVASSIRDAASTYLWRDDLNRFCRMLHRDKSGKLQVDGACDASLWGLFAFGMYTVDDPRIIATVEGLRENLWLKTKVGGMARYEKDNYHKVDGDHPGNPWFICTLWLADYLVEKAKNKKELKHAIEILEWVADHALPSGVLAEQVHPLSGEPLSVSPLTWSHATFVATTEKVLHRMEQMDVCPSCGLSKTARATGEDWLSQLYSEACDSIKGLCKIK